MNQTSVKYYPQLDAIRGLSFIGIYFFHAWHPASKGGVVPEFFQYIHSHLSLSIDVFYILSAFLLTWLGIGEYRLRGNFSIKNYFARRILRIWPLYYLIMLLAFIVFPFIALKTGQPMSLPSAPHYLFFIANFYKEPHVYLLQVLWSISVEEQFYIFWGFSLLLFQQKIRTVIAILFFTGLLFCFYRSVNNYPYYFHTATYLMNFAIGAMLAVTMQNPNKLTGYFEDFGKRRSFVLLMLLPLIFILSFILIKAAPGFSNITNLVTRILFLFYCAFFMLDQLVNKETALKLCNWKRMIYTGKISYGLYCFHGIVLTVGGIVLQKMPFKVPFLPWIILLLAVDFLVAHVSYRYYEQWFLRLKEKMRRI